MYFCQLFLQEVKENLDQLLFNEEMSLQIKNFNIISCFELVSKIIKLSLNIQEQIKTTSIEDFIPKNETDLFIILSNLEGEIIKLKKVLHQTNKILKKQ